MRYLALKIGMKYQSYYPYPLQVDFESPLWDFIKKDGNEKIVGDLMVKRMQNGLRYKRMNNGEMESFISKTGDYHHYYGCNNPDCTLHKKTIKRDEVHNAVREKLTTLSVGEKMIKVLELIYKEELQLITKDKKVRNKSKEERIANLQKEMKAVENVMEKITNDKLFQKKQEEWAKLNQEMENTQREINDQDFEKDEQDKVFNEAKTILCNPAAIRDFGDAELKQLVIRVCFNNKIIYKKNQGLHTPEISGIYLAKERLLHSSVRKSGGDETRTRV